MPVTTAPSDRELLDALREQGGGDEFVALSRRPYRYATSAALEELRVRTADGGERTLILKDLSRRRMLDDARATKPDFLHEPLRELEAYRRILGPAGIGARCFAAAAEPDPPRHWLVLEKVPGVELWQIGEHEVWEAVAAWLGGFHARFAGREDELRAADPHLLAHSAAWFRSWRDRARAALADGSDPRGTNLVPALDRYDAVVEPLTALPATLVHGELYPSNVLVVPEQEPVRVCPVDWEMAAIGPGLLDLAALVGGFGKAERARLVEAYLVGLAGAGATVPPPDGLAVDLLRCRLQLALQWLGWARDWNPPKEHAHDWLGEALALAEELELA